MSTRIFPPEPERRFSIEQGHCAGHHFCRVSVELVMRPWNPDTKQSRISETVIGEGVAKRNFKDKNDEFVGKSLALSRALRHLSIRVDKRAWGKVKHNDDVRVQRRRKRPRNRFWHSTVAPMTRAIRGLRK